MSITPDQFANFASSTIAGGASGAGTQLLAADVTMTVKAGDGALFPSTAPFSLLLGTTSGSHELISCTARSTDTLTIARAQEGTTALTWNVGTKVQQVLTAGSMADLWAQLQAFQALPIVSGNTSISVTGSGTAHHLVLADTDTTGVIELNATTGLSVDGGKLTTDGAGKVSFATGSTDPSNAGTTPVIRRSSTGSTLDVVGGTSGLRVVKNQASGYSPVFSVSNTGGVTASGALSTDAATITSNGSGALTVAKLTSDGSKVTTDGSGHITISGADVGNADVLVLKRTGTTANQYAIGMEPGGGLYIFDNNAGAFLLNASHGGTGGTAAFAGNLTSGAVITAANSMHWGGSGSFADWDGVNHINTYWTPQSGGSHNGHVFVGWNGAAQVNVLSVGQTTNTVGSKVWIDESGDLALSGGIINIGGQSTGSSFGVPVIVAQTNSVAVASTALTTVVTFTPPANGLYRVNARARVNNGTSPQNIKMQIVYTDVDTNASVTHYMTGMGNGSTTTAVASGSSAFSNQAVSFMPQTIYAKSGVAIVLSYQDPLNTPNDTASGFIERIS